MRYDFFRHKSNIPLTNPPNTLLTTNNTIFLLSVPEKKNRTFPFSAYFNIATGISALTKSEMRLGIRK